MKTRKIIYTAVILILVCTAWAAAESSLIPDFNSFGIRSIGIYTEAYEDERTMDPESSYVSAYAMQDVTYFRYVLCDFDAVTPRLTSQGYPLAGTGTMTRIDKQLTAALGEYLEGLGWDADAVEFGGGSVKQLRAEAESLGHDAVMIIRYYPIEYFIPISNYRESYGYNYNTYSASIGKIRTGLGLIPAAELYDTKTGVRLWYSAYYTGNAVTEKIPPYQTTVNTAESFFASGDSAEKQAVDKMISIAFDKTAFPRASASAARDESVVAANASTAGNIFWSSDASFDSFGTLMGFGYCFDYIGNLAVYEHADYYDDSVPDTVVATLHDAMMHRLTMPMFAFGTGNISVEPIFYIGYMPGSNVDVEYLNWDDEIETGSLSISAFNMALELQLKYFLRFDESFSAFIGGRGTAEMWLPLIDVVSGDSLYSSDYDLKPVFLYEFGDGMGINASVIAGVRFEIGTPIEIFAAVTPVGPGGAPMITGGLTWHSMMVDWIAPHAKNVAVDIGW